MSKRKIELSALLEITQAINSNISSEDLYKVFYFSCISLLRLGHVALFVLEGDELVEKFSQSLSFTHKELEIFKTKNYDLTKVQELSPHVEQVFPVRHNGKLLAVLFIGEQNVEESETSFSFLQTLSNIMMVAIENKRLARLTIAQERLAKESEIARGVQEQLIPNILPNNELIRVAATYLPHQSVGGDYYDVIKLSDDDYIFCMADVSGKGVPAALIMSNFQATLRALVRMTNDVEVLVRDLNMHIMQNARSDHFVTCFLAYFNGKSRTIEYVNAGHNPPFFINNKQITTLDQGCFMLGAFRDIPLIQKGKIYIPNNSKLFLFTDGITETMNATGEDYGEDRLEKYLLETMEEELTINLANLIVKLDEFKGEEDFRDDLTMLNIRFL